MTRAELSAAAWSALAGVGLAVIFHFDQRETWRVTLAYAATFAPMFGTASFLWGRFVRNRPPRPPTER